MKCLVFYSGFNRGALRDLRGEPKLFFTAEHAETAEGKNYNAFVVSGAASMINI